MKTRPALGEDISAYLGSLQIRALAKGTIKGSGYVLRNFQAWCEARGLRRSVDIESQHILGFEADMLSRELAARTRQGARSYLRCFFRWLLRRHSISATPFDGLKFRHPAPSLPRTPLREQEVERLLAVIDVSTPAGLRDRAIVELLYSTGMRRFELIALDLPDVDISRGLASIRHGKGDKGRTVPVGERALWWLHKYLTEVRPFLGAADYEPAIFLSVQSGRRLVAECLPARFREYRDRAGLTKEVGAHVLRHTAATLMLENGAGVRFIQELLGHENLDTTVIYTRVAPVALERAHRAAHPAEQGPALAPPAAGETPKRLIHHRRRPPPTD